MQGEVANGWSVLALLACMAAAWRWAHLQLSISTQRKQRGKGRGFVALFLGGMVAAFGMFCLAGAILLPDPTHSAHIVGGFGVLVLIPFARIWWRNRASPIPAEANNPAGAATAPVVDLPDPVAVPMTEQPVPDPSYVQPPDLGIPLQAEKLEPPPIPGSAFHAFTNPVKSQKSPPVAVAVRSDSVSLPCTFIFTYADSTGVTEQRTVDVERISSNGRMTYLEGRCHDRKAERTFRTDRIRGSLTDMDSGELIPVKRLLSSVSSRTRMEFRPEAAPKPAATKKWETAVLFTGFAAARRAELEELAYAAGWDVRSTVGSTLDYLVTGPRGGSSKVAKAEELGVSVIDEDLFRALV